MGNYKDAMMEQLADKGNGNNYYIDSFEMAKRVFAEQLTSTLEVAAKARAGEVLVSSAVKDLTSPSEIRFKDRGVHQLKGVPKRWRLYRVEH